MSCGLEVSLRELLVAIHKDELRVNEIGIDQAIVEALDILSEQEELMWALRRDVMRLENLI